MKLTATDVLLVIDLQNDFMPGGALAVPDGDAVIAPVNTCVALAPHVVLTQDWHPSKHISFASTHGLSPFSVTQVDYGAQVMWPDHCVQGTEGASLSPKLLVDKAELIVRKGHHLQVDSYSAFTEADRRTSTGLGGYLRERGFRRVLVCGLATDYCVGWSALDARSAGFDVLVIEDACRGIDLDGSLQRAWDDMTNAGIARIVSTALS